MSGLAIFGIVIACLFGGCVVLGAIGSASQRSRDERVVNAAYEPASDQAHSAAVVARSAPPPEPPKPKEWIKVSAEKLIKDYDGNEIRGDAQWKGQAVEVAGVVRSIDKGPFGGLYVSLTNGERHSFRSVRVDLKESEEQKAMELNKGDKVALRGTVLGYTMGSVSVRDSVLVEQ